MLIFKEQFDKCMKRLLYYDELNLKIMQVCGLDTEQILDSLLCGYKLISDKEYNKVVAWDKLNKWLVQQNLSYSLGEMMSMQESIHGERVTTEIILKMDKLLNGMDKMNELSNKGV